MKNLAIKGALLGILGSLLCISESRSQEISSFEIDSLLTEYYQVNEVPGVVVGIVSSDSVFYFTKGLSDLSTNNRIDEFSILNIASVSKLFTAIAIMQLYEKGIVSLEEDINKYLSFSVSNPNFREIPITIQQLLTHTSGITDGAYYPRSYVCGETDCSLVHWLRNNLQEDGLYYESGSSFLNKRPGEEYYYSNIGYGLLANIVSEKSDVDYKNYCRTHIFEQLKMTSTSWSISDIDQSKHVTPYLQLNKEELKEYMSYYPNLFTKQTDINKDTIFPLCKYSFPNFPDGGLRTSVFELTKFLNAILDGSLANISVLSDSTFYSMLSSQVSDEPSQGLGFHYLQDENMWGHGGADPGIRTQLYFSLQHKVGIVVLQNSNKGDILTLLKKIYYNIIGQRN